MPELLCIMASCKMIIENVTCYSLDDHFRERSRKMRWSRHYRPFPQKGGWTHKRVSERERKREKRAESWTRHSAAQKKQHARRCRGRIDTHCFVHRATMSVGCIEFRSGSMNRDKRVCATIIGLSISESKLWKFPFSAVN